MKAAICHISVVPVRNSPSNKSEQLSQLLFGEIVEPLEEKGKSWTKVRCIWDNCIGWVLSSQITRITQSEFEQFEKRFAYCLNLFQPLMSDHDSMPIPIGSRLPDFDGIRFNFAGKTYRYSGQAVFPENLEPSVDKILKISRRYLSAPYQWGGRSPLGIDAPGFTQMVLKLVGIKLLRTSDQQVHQGELIDFIEQSQPGDLAFFENRAGNIAHVGIILPENKIIHAHGKVRINTIDHYGIFDDSMQKYTYKLRVIKRILPPEYKAALEPENKREEFPQTALFS